MKLSIIIVSYNEAEYLPECFESILNQNLNFEYEVIVGDDGSSDDSIEVIKRYSTKFKNFQYFIQDREPGLTKKDVIPSIRASNVMFRAMSLAKGSYLNIISGDDYFTSKDFHTNAINFLDKNDSYAAYVASFSLNYPNGEIEINNILTTERFSFWHKQYIHCSCFVFRNLQSQNVLLNTLCDDCGLQYSIGLNGKLHYVNESVFSYRQRESSIMHSNDRLEIDLTEMMLFQDVLNKKLPSIKKIYSFFALYLLTFRHFKGFFLKLYNNRIKLEPSNFTKYANETKKFRNDIIGALFYPNKLTSKLLFLKIFTWIKISDFCIKYKENKKKAISKVFNLPQYPIIENNKNQLNFFIDNTKIVRNKTCIRGWAFKENEKCSIYIGSENKIYDVNIEYRYDVLEVYKKAQENCGFYAIIPQKISQFSIIFVNEEKKCIYKISEIAVQ